MPILLFKSVLYSCFPAGNVLAASGVMLVPLYQNVVDVMVQLSDLSTPLLDFLIAKNLEYISFNNMISFTFNLGTFSYLEKLLVVSKQLSTSKAIFSLDASLALICINFVFVQTHFRSAFNYWMGFTNQKCKHKHTSFLSYVSHLSKTVKKLYF